MFVCYLPALKLSEEKGQVLFKAFYCCLSSRFKAETRQVSAKKCFETFWDCLQLKVGQIAAPRLPFVNSHFFSVQLFLTFISMSSVCDLNEILRAQLLIFQTKKANLCYI